MVIIRSKIKEEISPIFLSVIVPAYNEERKILHTLISIDAYLANQPYNSEIVVISDGSRDETVSIVQGLRKLIPNLVLVANQENHGKGFVVRQGMLLAQGEFRLFMDADNSTSVDHVEKMWPFFREGYGVVIGSRDMKGAWRAVPQPKLKEWMGDLGNIFIQVVAGLWGLWDTQCGFKGYSRKAAEDIFSHAAIDRWGFDVEALVIARSFGYRIREIPVYWINDPHSRVKFSAYFEVLWETVKVRWNVIRDAYGIRRMLRERINQARRAAAQEHAKPALVDGDEDNKASPVAISRIKKRLDDSSNFNSKGNAKKIFKSRRLKAKRRRRR